MAQFDLLPASREIYILLRTNARPLATAHTLTGAVVNCGCFETEVRARSMVIRMACSPYAVSSASRSNLGALTNLPRSGQCSLHCSTGPTADLDRTRSTMGWTVYVSLTLSPFSQLVKTRIEDGQASTSAYERFVQCTFPQV